MDAERGTKNKVKRPRHPASRERLACAAPSLGHTGAGGRLGIADREYQVGCGYVCSRMETSDPTATRSGKR
ncbi:hypothetical protein GCM10009777_37000 [Microbacterium pumilum]|uniref:Uncharacterized protein n=1 Tax=Microbacterium pumilum TaxID=344165 RepID=A0ABN2T1F9_9MICO